MSKNCTCIYSHRGSISCAPIFEGYWYNFPMQLSDITLYVYNCQKLYLVQDGIECCASIQIDISILKGFGYKSRHIAH